ncbi:MAG: dihydroxy-acid dehydratase [Thermodesulfovibrionales bacterium]|nr:dihydroxy-acid dehydratase [Thermodesulfovibrionales bacterium]
MSPEAMEGGVIAVVQEGDTITIDIKKRKITLEVPQKEIERRLSQWKKPKPKIQKGYLSRYARNVSSAASGAIMR